MTIDERTESTLETTEKKKKINIVWDASLMDAFMTCNVYYYYRHVLLRSPMELAPALDSGSLFHVGKEHYFRTLMETRDWDKSVQKGLEQLRLSSLTSELESKDVDWIIQTYNDECEWNRTLDLSYTIHYVEKAFMYILYEDDNIRIVMIGKIDLGFSDKNYTTPTPLDHKTFARDFGLNRRGNQFVNYATATDSNYLFVNRVGLQRTVPKEKKYTRLPLSFDEVYKEQWKVNVIKWAYDYIEARESNDWPENPTSCFKYNRQCDYYNICETSGDDNKMYKLAKFYKKGEPWDVSKALKKSD